MSRGLVWFRRDLRIHDNPALATAIAEQDQIIPFFMLDSRLLGRGGRDSFLFQSLTDLYQAFGEKMLIIEGEPEKDLADLAQRYQVNKVYYNEDFSPFALRRDRTVVTELNKIGVDAQAFQGNYCIDIRQPKTAKGKPVAVFANFFNKQKALPRRPVEGRPRKIKLVDDLPFQAPPSLISPLPEPNCHGGERMARRALSRWFRDGINSYRLRQNSLPLQASGFSAWLRFGNLSPRELEERCYQDGSEEALAFARQLAWRDFYAHILFYYPENLSQEFQPRYRQLSWDKDQRLLEAWQQGQTGYPIVDAAMRQLAATGFMHGRARMVVGSFLTKDLHLDWRLGQAWFDQLLLDGEPAQNNGNWQWIASTGVDPSPYFQRIFSPIRQQQRFDPEGQYIRRWLPELKEVPNNKLAEPWTMTDDEQQLYRCIIGQDYPEPIIDHKVERQETIRRFQALKS